VLIARAECDLKTQESFLKLCKRPCFFRSWIILEISLAKHAMVVCGAYTQDFETFSRVNNKARKNLFGSVYHPLRGINGADHYLKLKSIRSDKTLIRRIERLSGVIECSRFCESSDPKDKVYSLLCLIDQPIISIDYSRSVADLYRAFTQAVIEKTNSVEILHWMGTAQRQETLGSWVHNFSVSKPQGTLRRVYGLHHRVYHINYQAQNTLPGLEFRGVSDFVIKGKYIESIQSIGPELVANMENIPGSESFSKTLYAWESLAVKLVDQKRFKNLITYAFIDTITADDLNINQGRPVPPIPYALEQFLSWYRYYGTNILRDADPDCVQEIAFIQSWSNKHLSEEDHKKNASSFAQSMEVSSYGRSFFITSQNSMGLAPPKAKPGDELVFFPGGLYPFVIRKNESDGSYELIGDCFLYDINVFTLFEDESKEVKEFVLR